MTHTLFAKRRGRNSRWCGLALCHSLMSLRAWLARVGWVGEINCGLMAAAMQGRLYRSTSDEGHGQLFRLCWASSAWHSRQYKGGFLQTKHPSCQCVPSTAINSFGISNNYLFAFFTPVGQVLVVTFVAPWFAFHCYKRLSRQRFVAVVTTKMIMMPLLVHGFKNTFLGVDQL